jgi:NAD(P)-dependent dehydrogenase (short-subunit alcohol dehydrogenase family)
MSFLDDAFGLDNQVAIVTGGTGVLGGAMAHGLAQAGAKVGIVGRRVATAERVAQEIVDAGGRALALPGDVLDSEQMETVANRAQEAWGRIDILVNVAGGNIPDAVIMPDESFFDMPRQAFEQVVALNLTGTVLPSQIMGRTMAEQGRGCIVNISSMAAQRTLTRVVGYSAAKAGVDNFTRWLAVEMAQKYGSGLRVNAIAPGFFIGEQNRSLLLNADDSLTPRGEQIINHTPLARFGEPDELVGALIWLCSDAARFVTGIVVPVDGGFSAYSGV